MQARLLSSAIQMFLNMLTPELLRDFTDTVLDYIEDKVAGSASTVDDRMILPLCEMIRATFGVEDNDE